MYHSPLSPVLLADDETSAIEFENGMSLIAQEVLVRDTPFLGSCGYPGVTPAPTAV